MNLSTAFEIQMLDYSVCNAEHIGAIDGKV